ncbi:dTDP-4-dehydrorhamnose reductase [soil metagenome]
MKILGTGLTGLVGSRIVELLKDKYEFENISRSTGVDITNKEQVHKAISETDAEIVFHLAAKADVDGCEKDKELGEQGEAWKINVEGTRNVVLACEALKKKLVYISTDFVFDGEKELYTEDDTPRPVNFYAKTKYEGEKIVQTLTPSWLILRIAYPYRAQFEKNDFVRAVKGKLEKGEAVTMVTDHIFCPTFIDDIANALDRLLMQEATGIFHVVGGQALSPLDVATKIAKEFDYETTLISATTRAEFFKDRAIRPFRLALNNDKISKLGIQMRSFEEGLTELKIQIDILK